MTWASQLGRTVPGSLFIHPVPGSLFIHPAQLTSCLISPPQYTLHGSTTTRQHMHQHTHQLPLAELLASAQHTMIELDFAMCLSQAWSSHVGDASILL